MGYLLLIIFILVPSVCMSVPDKYSSYVLDEPLTLHDFAMFALNDDFNELFNDKDFIVIGLETIKYNSYENMTYVDYDYDSDIYTVNTNIFLTAVVKYAKPKDIAIYFIDTVRSRLGYIISKDNKSYKPIMGHSVLSDYMSHWGYNNNKPKDLSKNIDKKIVIKSTINMGSREVICKTTPTDINIYCSE